MALDSIQRDLQQRTQDSLGHYVLAVTKAFHDAELPVADAIACLAATFMRASALHFVQSGMTKEEYLKHAGEMFDICKEAKKATDN